MSSKIFAIPCKQSFIFRHCLQRLILHLSVSDCHCGNGKCVAGLSSQQWGQKKAAAKALADLAEAGGDALPPHAPALMATLLQVAKLLPPANHCDYLAMTNSLCPWQPIILMILHARHRCAVTLSLYVTAKTKFCLPSTSEVIQNLLQELPGRLWDGKEAMLSAVAAVSKAAPKAVMSSTQPTSSSKAVVDALMAALARKKQTYR